MASSNNNAASPQVGEGTSRIEVNRAFFRERQLVLVGVVAVIAAICAVSSALTSFDFVKALQDFPGGFVWFVQHFTPNAKSFQKLDTIMGALFSTLLDSIAAGTCAAVLAYICAVLGSRSVGLGGPVPIVIRAIASVFRNVPIVAWAFLLLFSFKQSEFTGFLALFLQSFGFLTRSFLETIDEMSAGPIEALRASGATYLQLVVCAVIPLSMTQVVSWVLYNIETNIRDATLVGLLTGTGIGFVFDVFYKSFRYETAGLLLGCVVVVVIACELFSNYIRRKVQ